MKEFFELRGELSKANKMIVQIVGLFMFIFVWHCLSIYVDSEAVLPSPWKVLIAFQELYTQDLLAYNAMSSIQLNLHGYMKAILFCIPIGFIIGLFPLFKELTERYVNALRYIPLTAVTGLFIAWYGIEYNMKVQFLAFGIIVYLLPVVVQRIVEVEKVYHQTAYTLGASKWQIIKSVYFPSVISRVSDDIRVLTAISWTYIIVAEMVNNQGGIGGLIFTAARQSRLDKVFAILIVIIIIGFIQDKIFQWLDKKLFPYKHI